MRISTPQPLPLTQRKAPAERAPAAAARAQAAPRQTALQKHVAFFDQNGDRSVTVAETEQGLRALGVVSALKARVVALGIVLGLGKSTSGKALEISVDNIKAGKHGSDTGIYDKEGELDPAAFQRMFDRFDANRSNALSTSEIAAMIQANKTDTVGSLASKGEFRLLMSLAADTSEPAPATGDQAAAAKPEPAISRETLQAFYDGTLFYKLAEKRRQQQP